MTNLTSRILSAIVALIILAIVIFGFGQKGVYGLVFFAVARTSFEIARMSFRGSFPKFATIIFVILNLLTFSLLTYERTKPFSTFFIILSFVVSVLIGIIFHKKFKDLTTILSYVSQSVFGCVYTAVIPACVVWLVYSENGMQWFFCLLAVVFSGDIGAYLFGVTMGKTKIAPSLSPNKSLQGSFGGLLFSTITAYAFSFVLVNIPIPLLLVCGLFGGALGQVGDFFESLIKRVAGVKDSGSIMPGHGGVLDRIDGVLLASPLFYFAANYHSLWS